MLNAWVWVGQILRYIAKPFHCSDDFEPLICSFSNQTHIHIHTYTYTIWGDCGFSLISHIHMYVHWPATARRDRDTQYKQVLLQLGHCTHCTCTVRTAESLPVVPGCVHLYRRTLVSSEWQYQHVGAAQCFFSRRSQHWQPCLNCGSSRWPIIVHNGTKYGATLWCAVSLALLPQWMCVYWLPSTVRRPGKITPLPW